MRTSAKTQIIVKINIINHLKITIMAKKTKKEYSETPKLNDIKKSELNKDGIFMIVNIEDKYRIGMAGRWLTNEVFDSAEAAENYIQTKPWELIMNLAGVIAEFVVKENNKQ